MNAIVLNPNITTTAAGSFDVSTEGYVQGTMLDDPAVRYALAGGLVGPNETYPMWGGIGISEVATPNTGSPAPNRALGPYLTRAIEIGSAGVAGSLTGFTVFNQVHSMINTPQSPVPLAPQGGMMNFFRLGSGARIAVAMAPALIDLSGEIVTTQTSWDFFGQQLVPYVAAYPQAATTAEAYTSSTGIWELTFASAPGPVTGDYVQVFGSSVPALNGSFLVASTASAGVILNLQAAIGLGSLSPTGATLAAGGGAAPVRVLDVYNSNCMTVVYNPLTGFATWNRNGACAIILI